MLTVTGLTRIFANRYDAIAGGDHGQFGAGFPMQGITDVRGNDDLALGG